MSSFVEPTDSRFVLFQPIVACLYRRLPRSEGQVSPELPQLWETPFVKQEVDRFSFFSIMNLLSTRRGIPSQLSSRRSRIERYGRIWYVLSNNYLIISHDSFLSFLIYL